MAQDGDTITYTFDNNTDGNDRLIPQTEDISNIGEITVDYLDGAGGQDGLNTGGFGGKVENAVFDASSFNTLHIWVATQVKGRYNGGIRGGVDDEGGGGSTEISFFDTDETDTADEPFLAGAGGGGSSGESGFTFEDGPSGGRQSGSPEGGTGGTGDGGGDGFGAIDDQNRGYTLNAGTTTQGGGSPEMTEGEIQLTYISNDPPSFDSGTESPVGRSVGESLDTPLSIDVSDPDGDSLDVTFYNASDDSQIGSTQTVNGSGTATVTWSSREYDTQYSWYAEVDDGSGPVTSSTFSFTIPAPVEFGETVTYSFSDGTSVAEDISGVDTLVVDYLHGSGGSNENTDGGSGGAVSNTIVDVSTEDRLYIWVSGSRIGRYNGTGRVVGISSGSTEISFSNTDDGDSSDEPFLVGAGGGGTGWGTYLASIEGSVGAARGGSGAGSGGSDGNGTPPPKGGDGAPNSSSKGGDGDGAVDDQSRGYIVDGGTTAVGGGNTGNGEVKITYGTPPEAPSGLNVEVIE